MSRQLYYFKFLGQYNKPSYGRQSFQWSLPKNGKPGAWMTPVGKESDFGPPNKWRHYPILCERGLHACGWNQIFKWFNTNAYLLEVHPDAKIVEDGSKFCVDRARLVEKLKWNVTEKERMLRRAREQFGVSIYSMRHFSYPSYSYYYSPRGKSPNAWALDYLADLWGLDMLPLGS